MMSKRYHSLTTSSAVAARFAFQAPSRLNHIFVVAILKRLIVAVLYLRQACCGSCAIL